LIVAPVIIIGMHRSGTTLISKMLEELGLYIGEEKQHNYEALFFLQLNSWLFREASAQWDNPLNFEFINNFFLDKTNKVLEYHLRAFHSKRKFIGSRRSFRYSSIKDLDFPWGWKDPRNTFTIANWLTIFPTAKILHIYRNPIDVAESLRKREENNRQDLKLNTTSTIARKVKEMTARGTVAYQTSYRVDYPMEGIKLWELYVKQAFKISEKYDNDVLNIKYEDFLKQPETHLNHLTSYCGLSPSDDKIEQVCAQINSSRRFAFQDDPRLMQIHEQIRDLAILQELGYDQCT
jgi:hypothetical protein